MNLSTFLISIVVAGAVILAVRYTHKHGSCESCGGSCNGHCNLAAKIPFDEIRQELDAEKKGKI